MEKRTLTLPALVVLAATLAVAGCNKSDESSASRNEDTVVAQSQPTPPRSETQTAPSTTDQIGQTARDTGNNAKQAGKDVGDSVGNKVSDAVITTSVNAELAKDPNLSALKINVDTDAGRVALHGTAPDASARERATQLASSVKGVVSVDNQLNIKSNK